MWQSDERMAEIAGYDKKKIELARKVRIYYLPFGTNAYGHISDEATVKHVLSLPVETTLLDRCNILSRMDDVVMDRKFSLGRVRLIIKSDAAEFMVDDDGNILDKSKQSRLIQPRSFLYLSRLLEARMLKNVRKKP